MYQRIFLITWISNIDFFLNWHHESTWVMVSSDIFPTYLLTKSLIKTKSLIESKGRYNEVSINVYVTSRLENNIYFILRAPNQIFMHWFKNPKCVSKMCITSGCCLQHFPKTMNIFEEHFGFIEIPFLIWTYLNLLWC